MRDFDPIREAESGPKRSRGLEVRNPRPVALVDILGRAQHLGYLKTEQPTGPVVEAYQSWCYRLGMPMVLLYPCRDETAAVVYRLPDPQKALSQCAVDLIRRRTEHSLCTGRRGRQIICRGGGEILGLDYREAEAVAFWIADYALSSDRTGPLTPSD